MSAAQAILLAAITLDFGVRLNYQSNEPPTVFDRLERGGLSTVKGEAFGSWSQEIVVQELTDAFSHTVRSRRQILSMELFAAAALESNDRARFVMAVSALEPLAEQIDLGREVADFVSKMCSDLKADPTISPEIQNSLRGRILQLKRESVRQALFRLCENWFPGDRGARNQIDSAYKLRSEILHEGRLADLDVDLAHETRKVEGYLRRIYAKEFGIQLRVPVTN